MRELIEESQANMKVELEKSAVELRFNLEFGIIAFRMERMETRIALSAQNPTLIQMFPLLLWAV